MIIVYRDKDGSDFHGLPWILNDFNSNQDCFEKATEMESEGYKDVMAVDIIARKNDITWDDVLMHQI